MSRAWQHTPHRPLSDAECRVLGMGACAIALACAALAVSAPWWLPVVALVVGAAIGPALGHWCWRRAHRRRQPCRLVRLADYRPPKCAPHCAMPNREENANA
jgi:CHASE2 domain-containing sensor protein